MYKKINVLTVAVNYLESCTGLGHLCCYDQISFSPSFLLVITTRNKKKENVFFKGDLSKKL